MTTRGKRSEGPRDPRPGEHKPHYRSQDRLSCCPARPHADRARSSGLTWRSADVSRASVHDTQGGPGRDRRRTLDRIPPTRDRTDGSPGHPPAARSDDGGPSIGAGRGVPGIGPTRGDRRGQTAGGVGRARGRELVGQICGTSRVPGGGDTGGRPRDDSGSPPTPPGRLGVVHMSRRCDSRSCRFIGPAPAASSGRDTDTIADPTGGARRSPRPHSRREMRLFRL